MFSSHTMQTTGYLSCPPSPCTPSTISSVSPNFVPSSPSSAVPGTAGANRHNLSTEAAVASCPSSPTHNSSTNQLTPLASAVTSSMLTAAMMTSTAGASSVISSSMTLTSAISPPNSPPMLTALEGPATPLLEKEDILPLAYNMALLNTDTGQKHTVALSSTFKTILLYEKTCRKGIFIYSSKNELF